MSKYINADELKAKIYRLIKTDTSEPGNLWDEGFSTCGEEINDIITSLQQEQPEVDLEKIIEQTYHDGSVADTDDMDHVTYENIARCFYELSKNARKEE